MSLQAAFFATKAAHMEELDAKARHMITELMTARLFINSVFAKVCKSMQMYMNFNHLR
jgi:hypothetical protein